ncbi:hypothetical protein ACE02P_18085 [Shewanella bicestrii]
MAASNGLFLNWLSIEKKSTTQKTAIARLNAACGTKYVESWPSKMEARGYSMERVPTQVRRYMMLVVLANEFPEKTENECEKLVTMLT